MFYQKSPKVPNMRQNSHYPYSSSPEPAAPPPLHFCSYRLAAGAFWPRSLPPPPKDSAHGAHKHGTTAGLLGKSRSYTKDTTLLGEGPGCFGNWSWRENI